MPRPIRIFLFTCRPRSTDFRLPLAQALGANYETWYIFLKRRPIVQPPDESAAAIEMSLWAFLVWYFRKSHERTANLYLNSTNTAFPGVISVLWLIGGRGVWCMDMHDDLTYDSVGWRHWHAVFSVWLQTMLADLTVHAAQTLVELFPFSRHLGNASQVRPIERVAVDQRRVLILASLDHRFDFDFMARTAARSPSMSFDIYGQVSQGDPRVRILLDQLIEAAPNIAYHGPYGLADLESILGRYQVTLAPYRTGVRLTRYLDPLRFYHCLNSGMELITTRIPEAERWESAVHLVTSPADVAIILTRLAEGPEHQRNLPGRYELQTWQQRAVRLMSLVLSLPKMQRLIGL
jgi:hypothetical protein